MSIAEDELLAVRIKVMKKIAIKDFLIIDITGKNDSIGIRKNSNFFKLKIHNLSKIKLNFCLVICLTKSIAKYVLKSRGKSISK